MASRLVLVRHARVDARFAGRFIGASDPPLDEAGRKQAEALAGRVRRFAPGRCYCSPMRRCRQTFSALALDLPVEFDGDLREIDFGRWENHSFDELPDEDRPLVDRWAAFDADFAFPGGESLQGFFARVAAAADRMVRDPADTVLAVAHGGVIRATICRLLGLPPRNYALFEVDYAAVVVLRLYDGKGVLAFSRSDEPPGGVNHG